MGSKRDTIIPKRYARLALFVYSSAVLLWGSIEGVLILYYGRDSKALAVGGIIATGLLGILRLLTTNSFADLSGPAKMLIVGALALSLNGCAHWNPTPSQDATLVACAGQGIITAAVELLPDVFAALSGAPVDWAKELGKLLDAEGPKALCAVQVAADVLASRPTEGATVAHLKGMGGLGGSEIDPVLQARAEAWLELQLAQR